MFDVGHESEPFAYLGVSANDFGGIANCHLGLLNIEPVGTVYQPMLDRRTDPGAGGMTDYVDYRVGSTHAIQAGNELFLSYGQEW